MQELQIRYLNTKDLVPYENNPRKNTEAVKFVANSIKEFGFKNPIIIDKENVIVAGHTRLLAAQELGMETVPCILADDLTEKQIQAFRIADNKTAEMSAWDNQALKVELEGILDDFDMTNFGFGDFELAVLTNDFEPEKFDEEMANAYSENEDEVLAKKRVMITYTDEDATKVAEVLGVEEIKKIVYDISELI